MIHLLLSFNAIHVNWDSRSLEMHVLETSSVLILPLDSLRLFRFDIKHLNYLRIELLTVGVDWVREGTTPLGHITTISWWMKIQEILGKSRFTLKNTMIFDFRELNIRDIRRRCNGGCTHWLSVLRLLVFILLLL